MSKSLHDQANAIILRRENERLKQEEEKAKAKRDHTKEVIMADLDSSFNVCLEFLNDYSGHNVDIMAADVLDSFEEVSRELGFEVSYQEDKKSYHLSVPTFEKGTRRTPAQLKLFHFQQKLAKARKERKADLLSECKRVKELIREGKFTYDINHESITVKAECFLFCSFEREVVKSFFSKFKLQFVSAGDTNQDWVFNL